VLFPGGTATSARPWSFSFIVRISVDQLANREIGKVSHVSAGSAIAISELAEEFKDFGILFNKI
jgi:hypothetical protein